jgi:hypothetical protein
MRKVPGHPALFLLSEYKYKSIAIMKAMMRPLSDKLYRPGIVLSGILFLISFAPTVAASPFGEGSFGALVPFGSSTSLSISLGGNVNFSLTPSGSDFTGTGSNTITVTSTDPVGYGLYIHSTGSTSMVAGSNSIPASGNTTAGALSVNSWGYNTDGSSNYLGITTTPSIIKNGSGPFESGDNTTIHYGVLTDVTVPEGNYSVSVTYTAAALTD